jgi:uncharacterized SAM-binding protein YcdF (DUF218 family)
MWRRRALAAIAAAVMVGIALTLRWFVWPPSADPERADAVVALGGEGGRYERAVELMEQGVAPTLLLSSRRAEDTGEWMSDVCDADAAYEVVCFEPQPSRTSGEARVATRIAHERGYDRIVVVTARYHVTRAKVLFERCFDGDVQMVRAGGHIRLDSWMHEWGGLVHAWVHRDC